MGVSSRAPTRGAPTAGELWLALSFLEPKVQGECGKYADEEGKEVVGGVGGEEGEGQPHGKADDGDEDGERGPHFGRGLAFVDQYVDEVYGGDGDTHEGVAQAEVGLEIGAADPVAEEKDCEGPDEA